MHNLTIIINGNPGETESYASVDELMEGIKTAIEDMEESIQFDVETL